MVPKNVGRIILTQTAMLGSALGLIAAIDAHQYFVSTLLMGALLACNWWILSSSWGLVLRKKLIALVIPVIVTKYAILALVTSAFIEKELLEPIGVTVAFVTLIAAVFVEGALFCASR